MGQRDDFDISRPILGLSGAEAADILGVRELRVAQLVVDGVLPKAVKHQRQGLDRADVERLSLERYKPGRPYWITEREAAELLGISRPRVFQLRRADRLPFVERHGRTYYRRQQIEVIAHARGSAAYVTSGVSTG
jgi:hypothetical protein